LNLNELQFEVNASFKGKKGEKEHNFIEHFLHRLETTFLTESSFSPLNAFDLLAH